MARGIPAAKAATPAEEPQQPVGADTEPGQAAAPQPTAEPATTPTPDPEENAPADVVKAPDDAEGVKQRSAAKQKLITVYGTAGSKFEVDPDLEWVQQKLDSHELSKTKPKG